MAFVWSWLGVANVLASALLLVLGLLFLRAKRSEFAVLFAAYCALAAGQKFAGGVALYFASDPAERAAWLLAATLFLIGSTPALAHALAAFTWGRGFEERSVVLKAGIYAPFAALVPVVLLDPDAFSRLSLVFAGAFMAILGVFLVPVARKLRSPSPAVRAQSRYVLAYLVVALSFSLEARVLLFLFGRLPWWELSLAYMAATGILLYGILRTHLFDIDLKVKFALRQSTLAGFFIAVFFIVSELAASLFSGQVGPVLGIVAAGLLLFALAPLQRAAERVANAALPAVQDTPEYLAFRRLQVYKSALELAAEDGVISARQRDVLEGMQRDLGIPPADARAMERDVLAGARGAPRAEAG